MAPLTESVLELLIVGATLKVEDYALKGLPDPTDVSHNQQASVGKPTTKYAA